MPWVALLIFWPFMPDTSDYGIPDLYINDGSDWVSLCTENTRTTIFRDEYLGIKLCHQYLCSERFVGLYVNESDYGYYAQGRWTGVEIWSAKFPPPGVHVLE